MMRINDFQSLVNRFNYLRNQLYNNPDLFKNLNADSDGFRKINELREFQFLYQHYLQIKES